jgi:two-component system, OmpR family, sensor histidine kinase TctE
MFQTDSIRNQLMLWLLFPILVLWLIQCSIAYFTGTDMANDAYDSALADDAKALASRFSVHDGKLKVDLPEAAKAILEYDGQDKVYYQILGPDGKMLMGDPAIDTPPSHVPIGKLLYRNGQIHNQRVRIVTMRPGLFPKNSSGAVIQVAETLTSRRNLTSEILLSVILPQLSLIIVAALIVWFGVARGLNPLERIQIAVASRSPRDLHPLKETDAPAEVRPLVHAINDLLERLAEDLAIQRRFVANAAHQLRTPLAGLKMQAELALRQDHEEDSQHALKQIQTSVQRASHLAKQLLSLARSEPGASESLTYERVDLNQLARKATREFVTDALQKKIDLGFEGSLGGEQALIKGDLTSLHELVCNLVDNAIRYTHEGGDVTVRVTQNGSVNLIVEDNGPGIPVEERQRVFERFYRILGNEADGSGLGLSIVDEIAQAHAADIFITEGTDHKGTSVKVSFPA